MSKRRAIILGVESSCDDTGAAVISDGVLMSNIIAGQKVHQEFGGVVPELASRAHQINIVPSVSLALKQAGVNNKDISAVAFTRGPGLMGSLMVGASFAKGLAFALGVPLIEVNHMQAHVLAHFIKLPDDEKREMPSFPFLCLTVSGGHTQIVLVEDYFQMKVIGRTLDDAAGEAFDKTAKILGLPYPGGPLIDKLAARSDPELKFVFPKPSVPGLDYSFSGLKTAVLYFIRENLKTDPDFIKNYLPDLCASVQAAIVEILVSQLEKAAEETGIMEIALAGGVSANTFLRKKLTQKSLANNWKTHFLPFEFCTDNAAMIAITGYHKYVRCEFSDFDIVPKARLTF